MQRKLTKTIIIIVSAILTINLLFLAAIAMKNNPIYDLYENGLLIKMKPYAFLFAHGKYVYYAPCDRLAEGIQGSMYSYENKTICREGYQHTTSYKGITYSTEAIITEMESDGYTYLWGSWCQSGDHEYVSNYTDYCIAGNCSDERREILWPDWVDRNKEPGITVPLFVGFGLIRFSIDDEDIKW